MKLNPVASGRISIAPTYSPRASRPLTSQSPSSVTSAAGGGVLGLAPVGVALAPGDLPVPGGSVVEPPPSDPHATTNAAPTASETNRFRGGVEGIVTFVLDAGCRATGRR